MPRGNRHQFISTMLMLTGAGMIAFAGLRRVVDTHLSSLATPPGHTPPPPGGVWVWWLGALALAAGLVALLQWPKDPGGPSPGNGR